MSEITTLSSKGQIVIPINLRQRLNLDSGATFAIFGQDDTIVLKKIDIPKAREVFEKVHMWGVEFSRKKGIKEEGCIN